MLQVIGMSTTLEYSIKILYENTIGRIFSWFSEENISDEEKLIIKAQRAYSNYIYHTAWYEFEFLPWISKVWSVSNKEECSWLRKWERTIFFTVEFAFKAFYAQLIEWGAKTSYEKPVEEIFLVAYGEHIPNVPELRVVKEKGPKKMLAIPRWGPFTETIRTLDEKDLQILEISGNDEIAVSVLMTKQNNSEFGHARRLYESNVVTNDQVKRVVFLLPVKDLLPFIRFAKDEKIEIEHVFDY